jgi:cobalt/nickel transport system ATP-binding protein
MIKVEKLYYRYADGTRALQGIDLEVKPGEVLALIGASGCGKTTLLKHLIGLLKPASGKLYFNKKDYHSFSQEEIFRQVGMVFQDPNDQLFAATVEQDVAFGAINLGLNADEVKKKVRKSLEQVEAAHLAGKAIHSLSFGQKRRITIAGVLAMEPQVILLDEPTSGLDPRSVSAVMRLLKQLNREKGITMIIATHDVELIPLFCDRVAILKEGAVKTIGTTDEVFSQVELLRETDMRLPRIAHLTEILQKEDGYHFPRLPLTIGEARRVLNRVLSHEK